MSCSYEENQREEREVKRVLKDKLIPADGLDTEKLRQLGVDFKERSGMYYPAILPEGWVYKSYSPDIRHIALYNEKKVMVLTAFVKRTSYDYHASTSMEI